MTNFKDAGAKPLSAVCIGLRSMTDADWSNYVLHVTGAGEFFMQYGCEPTEEWIACIQTMTPDVIYYAVYLNEENVMVGYVAILNFIFSGNSEKGASEPMRSVCSSGYGFPAGLPAKGRQKSRRKPSCRISHRFGCLKSSDFKRRLSDSE